MTRHEAARFLLEADGFLILMHQRPDGDTVGSAAALCLGLRALGKRAFVLENPETDKKLTPFLEGLTKKEAENGDTVVAVDVPDIRLLPTAWQQLPVALTVDHHIAAYPYARHLLADPGAAACGEIIWDVLTEMGVALDTAMARALYLAVSTDSHCFRFAATSAHTFRVAAACAETGADLYHINQVFFDSNSHAKLKLQGWIVENAKFYVNNTVAVCALPPELEKTVSADDSDSLSSFLRSIEGVQVSAFLRQADNGVKLSMRAVPGYDVAQVCKCFGGGGHRAAAGATLEMSLEEATKQVTAALLRLMEEA